MKKCTNVNPVDSKRMMGMNSILEDRISCIGRQMARINAMPADMPERRACLIRNERAKDTRTMPPRRGPSPNRSDTMKPDTFSES